MKEHVGNDNPRLSFGRGVYIKHVLGNVYEWVTQGGTHIDFVQAEAVVYADSIEGQRSKQR